MWEGDLVSARRALDDAASVRRFGRYFDGDLHLARVLIATAEHRPHDAADAIAEAIDWTQATQMPVEEAIAWHAAVRIGRAERSVEQALATRCAQLAQACPGVNPMWWSNRNPPPSLTRREHEIARLAADGLASRAIADRLVLSVRTVDSHLYRVYTKLGVRDRAGLAAALAR